MLSKFNGKPCDAHDAATIGRAPSDRERISTPHCGENQSDPRARAKVRDAISWNVAR
jgi:hypothetical protein